MRSCAEHLASRDGGSGTMSAKRLPLRAALIVAVIFGKGALSGAQGPSQIFANPPAVSSENGHLEVDLTAQAGEFRIGGRRFQGLLYNGAYVPPVWRVRSGDSLVVVLHNRLGEPTNLHFHGLDVSPAGNGDN